MTTRPVKQLATAMNGTLYALCDDGTVWSYVRSSDNPQWRPLPAIPGVRQSPIIPTGPVEKPFDRSALPKVPPGTLPGERVVKVR